MHSNALISWRSASAACNEGCKPSAFSFPRSSMRSASMWQKRSCSTAATQSARLPKPSAIPVRKTSHERSVAGQASALQSFDDDTTCRYGQTLSGGSLDIISDRYCFDQQVTTAIDNQGPEVSWNWDANKTPSEASLAPIRRSASLCGEAACRALRSHASAAFDCAKCASLSIRRRDINLICVLTDTSTASPSQIKTPRTRGSRGI